MRGFKYFSIVLFVVFICNSGLNAFTGDYYLSFLKLGQTAKVMALRGANVCKMDDFSAVYSNPANLVRTQNVKFAISYANLYNQNVKYDAVGATFKYREFGLGTGFVYLETEKMDIYNQNASLIGQFKPYQFAYFAGVGHRLGDWSHLGASVVVSMENLYDETKYGVGFNVSAIMELDNRNELTFIARNIFGPSIQYTNLNKSPMVVGLGYYRKFGKFTNIYVTYLLPEGYKVGIDRALGENFRLFLGVDEYNYSIGLRTRLKKAFLDMTIIYTKNFAYYFAGSIVLNL